MDLLYKLLGKVGRGELFMAERRKESRNPAAQNGRTRVV